MRRLLGTLLACIVTSIVITPALSYGQENDSLPVQKVAIGSGVYLHHVERGNGVPIIFIPGALGDYTA